MNRIGILSVLRNRWMAGALVVLAFTAVFINWYYYREIRSSLDREFGIRLRSIASLVSANLRSGYSIDYSELDAPRLELSEDAENSLRDIRSRYSLASIMVIREDGKVLFSSETGLVRPGEDYLNWNMDYRAIVNALEGKASSTELIGSEYGSYMKAGYAPLNGPGKRSELVAAVEASPTFLKSMEDWRTSLMATSLLLAAGIILAVILILKSTDSLIRARESLLRSETLASMGRMTAVITHEIRNPLFIIRSSAEKLRGKHPDEAAEIDEFIIEEIDRLDRTLTEYLSFSRGGKSEKKRTDLGRILARSVKSIEKAVRSGGLVIETAPDWVPAPFVGDEKRLLQAFMNILVNSVQSLQEEGRITVGLDRAGESYRLVFSDNGPGIPEKDQGKVFEPFYTTRGSGSGLGLSVVAECVRAHGGSVELKSQPGSGTTITIYLPAGAEAESGEEYE
ncbi:MAG: hypothetical protein GF417_04040 [Candidatus Latescibacteria bacterium]|nr:hypothetical protein [bacterium]MBD3423597.1 hypothetical protein [Candidatus Latescibacterota bacterium]